MPGRRAFTIFELLAVITVLIVLLTLLLPALQAAREKGREVVCVSHLHQLGIAWGMYAFEHNNEYANSYSYADGGYTQPFLWYIQLRDSDVGEDMYSELQCPSMNRWPYMDDYACGGVDPPPECDNHVFPGSIHGGSRVGAYTPKGDWPAYIEIGYGYNQRISKYDTKPYYKFNHFKTPSTTGIQAESGSFYWYNYNFGDFGRDGYWYAERHGGQFGNVLFIDKHVARVTTPYSRDNPDLLGDP